MGGWGFRVDRGPGFGGFKFWVSGFARALVALAVWGLLSRIGAVSCSIQVPCPLDGGGL